MKKILLLWLICLFGNIANGQTLEIIGNGNLRSGPGSNTKIIGKVTLGMQVKQLDFSKDWFKIEMPNKAVGWVNKSLVKAQIINDGETKKFRQFIDDYIIIITIPNYKSDMCPFYGNKIVDNYLYKKLLELKSKYNLGNQTKAYVCPQGSIAEPTENIVIYKSYPLNSPTWFDILGSLYEDRGTFPKLEMRNSKYDVVFIAQGNRINIKANSSGMGWTSDVFRDKELKESSADVVIDEVNIIYNEGMEVRYNDADWIFKNKTWNKK